MEIDHQRRKSRAQATHRQLRRVSRPRHGAPKLPSASVASPGLPTLLRFAGVRSGWWCVICSLSGTWLATSRIQASPFTKTADQQATAAIRSSPKNSTRTSVKSTGKYSSPLLPLHGLRVSGRRIRSPISPSCQSALVPMPASGATRCSGPAGLWMAPVPDHTRGDESAAPEAGPGCLMSQLMAAKRRSTVGKATSGVSGDVVECRCRV